MKALHTLGAVGLALSLGACTTVGPDYRLPEKAAINGFPESTVETHSAQTPTTIPYLGIYC